MAERGLEVLVRFPAGISLDVQGEFLLSAERGLRDHTGLDVRVVKDLMGDDSKLRHKMSFVERAKL